jgi:catechol 2,3-dioxygenase-like lactoylglutathione lyase family enzyme
MQTIVSRRPGALGVHSIDHFALCVPDLDEARHFFTHFGLDVRQSSQRLDLYTYGNDHRWGTLCRGVRKRLQYVALLAFPDDIERFEQHFRSMGIESIAAPEHASVTRGGLWIATPDDLPIHISAGAKNTPNQRPAIISADRYSIDRAAPLRGTSASTRPERLSHILLFTKNLDRTLEFFGKALGLRLSDRSAGVAFMHGPHGSDHHLIAFADSNGYGLHHSCWAVRSIEEIGLGSEHMSANGYSRGWGLGRHVLGSNYFRYVRDPWGSYAEYSFDIDYVSAAAEWEVWTPAPENSLYLWGPEVPNDFVENYEVKPG